MYFVNDVLIDANIYSMHALHVLAEGLRASGLKICSIKKVVVTHYHVDHISLFPLPYDTPLSQNHFNFFRTLTLIFKVILVVLIIYGQWVMYSTILSTMS